MDALLYLWRKRIKNRLRLMVKNKGAMAITIFFIALLGFLIYSGNTTYDSVPAANADMNQLYAIIVLYYGASFVMTVYNGFARGASMFSMSDVNLLFSSPVSPKKMLFYGLMQQMGTALLTAFLLVFQYSWLHNQYGISFGFLIIILLGYGVTLFCGQLCAVSIYMLTSHVEEKRMAAKTVFMIICGLAAAYILLGLFQNGGGVLETLLTRVNDLPISLFPVAGWMKTAVAALAGGEWLLFIICLMATLAFALCIVILVSKNNPDYYEDVLQSAETSFSAIAAQKEGKLQETARKNIKLGKQGFNKGLGASVFYYKHLTESRRARLLLFDTTTMIFIIIIFVYSYFMRDAGMEAILGFTAIMQILTVGAGRWARELILPYVYMVPESEFKKLMYCLKQSMMVYAAEALVMGLGIGLIIKAGILDIFLFMLVRLSFAFLFTAGNMLVERIAGGLLIKWITMIIYFLVMVILAIPGILLGILMSSVNITYMLGMILGNVLVGVLVFYMCRNVLKYVELNN